MVRKFIGKQVWEIGKWWKDNIMIDFRETVSEYGRWIGWDSPIN